MRFFSADPHFGHRRICELAARPFTDVTTMNEMIVANWNSVVSPDDEAWILGDIALGPIMESLEYVGRLNGTKHMVWGNHDRCFPGSKKSAGMTPEEWVGVYMAAGFTSVRADGGLMPFIPDYRFVQSVTLSLHRRQPRLQRPLGGVPAERLWHHYSPWAHAQQEKDQPIEQGNASDQCGG